MLARPLELLCYSMDRPLDRYRIQRLSYRSSGRNAFGIRSFSSIVRYEMQSRESRRFGSIIASVGHASMQRVQVPQLPRSGAVSDSKSILMSTSARKYQEPERQWMRLVFLPIQPIPAFCAYSLSMMGAVSTQTRVFNSVSAVCLIKSTSSERR